jgi:hypothetical protein
MGEDDAGHEVALMFEGGDACKPVIIGRVEMFSGSVSAVTARPRPVVLSSDDEIVLHCGEAKLSLRKDGRVALRGTYVETRSKGVNRIKGGSVQIN